MKLKIGNKQIEAEQPSTQEGLKKGLLGRESIDEGKGMLFPFPNGKSHITMKGMKFPLDLIGIKGDRVSSVTPADIDKEYMGDESLILEVKRGSGIKPGDKVSMIKSKQTGGTMTNKEYVSKLKPEPVKMQKGGLLILDNKANVQKEISDGARIFSRIHTNQLFNKAKEISSMKNGGKIEPLYEELANMFFKFIDKQDNQEPEYV